MPAETAAALAATVLLGGDLPARRDPLPHRPGGGAAAGAPRAGALPGQPGAGRSARARARGPGPSSRLGESGDNPAITADPSGSSTAQVEALVRASVEAARNDVDVPSDLTPDIRGARAEHRRRGPVRLPHRRPRPVPARRRRRRPTVVLIGDSHARAWIPAFDRSPSRGRGGVLPGEVAVHRRARRRGPDRGGTPFTECSEFHTGRRSRCAASTPTSSWWPPRRRSTASSTTPGTSFRGRRHRPPADAGYDDLFADLAATRPPRRADPRRAQGRRGARDLHQRRGLPQAVHVHPRERSADLADVAVASARDAGVQVVDPTPWLCFDGDCPAVIGGTLSYRDTDHLTTEYSASLAEASARPWTCSRTDPRRSVGVADHHDTQETHEALDAPRLLRQPPRGRRPGRRARGGRPRHGVGRRAVRLRRPDPDGLPRRARPRRSRSGPASSTSTPAPPARCCRPQPAWTTSPAAGP